MRNRVSFLRPTIQFILTLFSGAFQKEILRGVSIQELSGNDSILTLSEMNGKLEFFDLIRLHDWYFSDYDIFLYYDFFCTRSITGRIQFSNCSVSTIQFFSRWIVRLGLSCPSGWLSNGLDGCVRVYQHDLSWEDASSYCRSQNSQLITSQAPIYNTLVRN